MDKLIAHGIEPTPLRGAEPQLSDRERERIPRRKRASTLEKGKLEGVEANDGLDPDLPAHAFDDLA